MLAQAPPTPTSITHHMSLPNPTPYTLSSSVPAALRNLHLGSSNSTTSLVSTSGGDGASTPSLSCMSYDTDDMDMDDGIDCDGIDSDGEPNPYDGFPSVAGGALSLGSPIPIPASDLVAGIGTGTDDYILSRPVKPAVTDFELLKTLGTGTFARVWLVRPVKGLRSFSTQLYALKVLKKTDVIRLKQVEHVLNERMILQLCKPQPFIINILSSWSDRESLYMLLDYSPGGEVFGYLRRNRRFDFDTTRFYSAEIVLILEFLHDNGIVYRDLKPENILLDARGHVKLVDFGFAKHIANQETYTLCGTPEYLSPEVIQSQGHTTAVDWWALGILIYEFLCGFPPFYAPSPFEIYERIVAGRIAFPTWMPPATTEIIQRLCTADRTSRLGNLKNGARDVKRHKFFEGVDWVELQEGRMMGPLVPDLAFVGDTRYFDYYDPPTDGGERYTVAMEAEYEGYFKDF